MSIIATYVYVSRDGGGDGSSDAYTMSFADALRFRGGSDDLIVVDATVSAADLNALDASTDGTVVTEPYVTMVTGSLPDVAAAYGSSGISGLGDETVALDDTTVAAADLLALDTATSGGIDASSVTTVTGSLSDVATAYASSGISGLGNAAVTLDDTTAAAADLNALAAFTSGTIDASSVTTVTGSLSDVGAAYASSGISGLGNAAVILDDTTVAAADLNALDALTSGVIDASSVTTLMGSLSDVATAYASSEISGLGNAVVTLDDATVAAGDLNALDAATNGTIDASSVTTLTGSLSAVAMALSSYGIMLDLDEAVTLDDTTVAAGDLNALDAVTNGTIDASSVTTLTGSLSAVAMALSSYGIMLDLDEAVTLDDTTVAAADLNALDTATNGTINAWSVMTLTGSLSDVGAAYASSGISGLGNAAVTLDDTTVVAADLNALDTAASGVIDASSVTTVTGSLSDVGAAYASSGISGLGNAAVTLDDTTVAAADLNALDTATSGTIDASSVRTVTGSLSDVATAYASPEISGLGNAAVTLDDTSVPAADLNALDDETSGAINASSVTMLTGTASAVATAYASSGIIGLGNAAVTLSVGTVAATDLYAIDLATSGNIYAWSVTTLTGSLSYVADVYASFGIFGLGVADVTLDDATVRADSLFELDTLTSGTIDASSVTTLSGALSAVSMAYILSGISGLGDEAVTLDDTTVAASDLLALDTLTTGVIDASSVTTLTGSLSDVAGAYTSSGISGLGTAAVTLEDTTVAAVDLNAIDAATIGTIDAAAATTVTGAAAAVATAYASSGISGLGNEAVTLDDTTAAAADLNAIDTATSGTIDAASVTTVTGSLSNVATAYASSGISGLGNAAVTLSDTTVAAVSLNALDAKTTGVIDASSVTTLTGAVSVVRTTYLSSGISGLGNEAVTLSDTILPAVALVTMDGYTSGTVDASSVTTLTGPLSYLAAAYASSGITGLGNEAVNLNDSTVAAADLNALDAKTSGIINASSVTTLTGTLSAVTTAYASSGISGLGNAAVTLSDTTAAAADLNALDTATTGVINASSVTTLTGTAGAVATAYASSGISGLGNETVTLSAGTAAASDLNAIDTATSGTINASSVTTVTGSLSNVATAYASSGITGLGNEPVTLSDTTVAAASLNALDAKTSGVIDASSVTTVTGSLSVARSLYLNFATFGTISGLGNEAVTLDDTTLPALSLSSLDASTSGTIDASAALTLSGSLSAVATVYASSGISGLGNAAVTLSDSTVAAVSLNALDAKTTGVIDASSVTTLTGSAAALAMAYASSGISGLGNESVTLSDTTVAAADLNALNTATSGSIDASSVTTLTGTAAAVATAYASSGISGLGNEAVTLSAGTAAASDLNVIDAATSGMIDAAAVTVLTGSLSAVAAAHASSGITGLGNVAVTLNDSTVAAADLNALDTATSGTIDAASVTTLTGTLSAVTTAYASSGITDLGNAAVTLSDTNVAAADLNALDTATSGTIDASSVTELVGDLSDVATAYASSGISGLGDEAVSLGYTTVAAADLSALDIETSGTIDASNVLAVTGSLLAVLGAYSSSGISGLGAKAVTLDDTTVTAADLNGVDGETSGTIDASSVTAVMGTAAAVATAYASSGISGLGTAAVTLEDTTVAAVDLNAIDAATSGTIDASSVTTVTGRADAVATAYASSGISGLGGENVTISGLATAASDLNAINAATSGTIDASVVITLMGMLSAVATAYGSSGISGLGNEEVLLSDTTVAAADLNALDAKTSGTIDASSVTTVTGSASAVATAYASSGISGLGNETVTLSAGTAAASDLNAIDAATSVTIDASSVTTVTGSLSDVTTAFSSSGISLDGDEAVTLSDTTVAAADLNALDALTTGMIDASSVTTVTGRADAVATAYASSGISGLGSENVTISGLATAASDLNAINAATSGTIDASVVITLTGTLSAVATAYTSSGITGLGDEAVTLSDTTVAAADLNALDAKTTGVIDASSVTTLTGAVSVVRTTYLSSGISGLGNEAVTLSDTILPAVALVTMDGYTSGTVDASSLTTLTGPLSYLAAAYASSGITGLGNEAVTLNDSTVAAADLNVLDTATSGIINASSVTTLTGSLSDVAAAYASSGITGLGNAAVTLSDTTVAAASLNALDTATSGTINASSVTVLTGTAAAVAMAYASSGISGLGNETVTLSAGTAAASDLNAIDAATSGTIDAAAVTTLMGTAAAVATAYASSGISGLGNENVTIAAGTAAASDLNTINAATSGTIDASSVTTLTGSLSAVATAYASSGISGLGNAGVTLDDTTVAAAGLNALDALTTGMIDASSVTTVTGTASAVATSYASSGISGLGTADVTVSGTSATASALNLIDANTTGTVDALSLERIYGMASDVATTYASSGISGLGNESVRLWDTVAAAADLNAINAATTGVLHAQSVLTVTGSLSDLTTAYTNAGIRGFGDEAVTLSDTAATATAINSLDGKTTGVIDASSVTTVTGTASAVATSYASSGISGLGTADVTVSGTSATASALNVIDANTTGTVDALSLERIYGMASDMATTYASSGISGLGNESVRLWDTVAAAADLNSINAATTGVLYAQSVLTVTGSLSDLTTTYTTAGIRDLGDEAVTLTDATVAATSLNYLDWKTTGVIDTSSVTTVTGTASAVATSYASSGISGLGTADVTVSGTSATASALNLIDANTTGTVDALSLERIYGMASDVATTYASSGISGLGNESVRLWDTVAAAADLNAINAATTGVLHAQSVLTVTGSLSDLTTAYTNAGIRGFGDEAVTLSDTAATATALNSLDGKTTGAIDASSVTTLTGTVSAVSTAIASAGISGLENAAFDITGTASAETIQGGVHGDTLSGLGGSDSLYGFGGNDTLNGGTGADTMTGGTGADSFIFVAGEANGDSVTDFSGSGTAGDGDVLVFEGYGDGASFTDLGGGLYEIANAARTVVDVIEVTGTIDVTDHRFELVV